MAIFHITTGDHHESVTFGFMEGPDGQGRALEAALKDFCQAHEKYEEDKSAKEEELEIAFAIEFGEPPQPLGTFGELYPDHVPILAAGRKHSMFETSKKAEKDFLKARDARRAEMKAYAQRQSDYVAKNLTGLEEPKLSDYIPAGFKPVKVESFHVRDLPYVARMNDE